MYETIMNHLTDVVSVILFIIGFANLLLHRNMIKKIIGLNIMDTAIYMLLASQGYITGLKAPIIIDGVTDASAYINPIPSGLVLTGIVVSVSVTALMLSMTIRMYREYHTLDLEGSDMMDFINNFPFFSIMLCMFSAIVTFVLNGKYARHLTRIVLGLVIVLSSVLLIKLHINGESFVYYMGHFPAPWGNEIRAGELEAILALFVSRYWRTWRMTSRICISSSWI